MKQVPGSLEQVLDALEADHKFLLEGGVFTPGPDRNLHCLQARKRSGSGASASASVGIPPLLRHLVLANL